MNWVLAFYLSLALFVLVGVDRYLASEWSSWPLQWSVSLPSLSTCPRLPPCSVLWRGALLALALVFAMTSLEAERRSAIGWQGSKDYATGYEAIKSANRLFPLEYRFRNGLAYAATAAPRNVVDVSTAISEVKKAIVFNPFAADLHADLMKLYAESGNQAEMQHEFGIVKGLAPNSPIVQQLEKAGMR